jgi:deoxyribodipyrimidine photo-lyase
MPDPASGGERAALARLATWGDGPLARYGAQRDDLAHPVTSRLSADLHFGCLSPLRVEAALAGLPGAAPFLRQLCWRDFFLQLLAARPGAAWSDVVHRPDPDGADPDRTDRDGTDRSGAHRDGTDRGRRGEERADRTRLDAWRSGRTGVPIVDAAMRQLLEEGFLPNRARMIAASFLTRQLRQPWQEGARHFLAHLVDADVAINNPNWQWMAGRGTGGNPQRVLSPTRQALRFDPDGEYVRRYVPELRSLDASLVHEPWRLGRRGLARIGYPAGSLRNG